MSAGLDGLGETVRALFDDTRHAGDPSEAGEPTEAGEPSAARVLRGEAGRAALGTQVRFCLRVAAGRVLEARYRAYGCPYTLATCEWLARRLTGAPLGVPSAAALQAQVGTPADWAESLGVPAERLGRLLVIEDALRAALGGPGPPSPQLPAVGCHPGSPNSPVADLPVTKGR